MFKIPTISLKIPRFLASIKNVRELVTMDLFCYLTVVGLSWLRHVFSSLQQSPTHSVISDYCHIESRHPNIEAECQLLFIHILAISLNYWLSWLTCLACVDIWTCGLCFRKMFFQIVGCDPLVCVEHNFVGHNQYSNRKERKNAYIHTCSNNDWFSAGAILYPGDIFGCHNLGWGSAAGI